MEANVINAEVLVREQPIKGTNEENISIEDIQAQAELGRQNLVPVNYKDVHGTCPDERGRIGLQSGSTEIEPRPAVFGGPDVYGLAIAELTGSYPEDGSDGTARLATTKKIINAADIKSGGHLHCAANAGIGTWMRSIVEAPDAVKAYAQMQLGENYDDAVADEVVSFARIAIESGRYDNWTEAELQTVLGDEAGEAIEALADVPHEGFVFQRNKVPNTTIDQTAVYEQSIVGPGSFDFDDHYAETIENAIVAGPEAVRKTQLARMAREMIIAAVAGVVPNETLFQSEIR